MPSVIWPGACSGKVTRWQPSEPSVMSGKRYLLDTNALVALLRGNTELLALTQSAEFQLLKLAALDPLYLAQGFAAE
nr:hypothetical protein [uncultured Albidiferax sp.]